jgi:hypothetical protein
LLKDAFSPSFAENKKAVNKSTASTLPTVGNRKVCPRPSSLSGYKSGGQTPIKKLKKPLKSPN